MAYETGPAGAPKKASQVGGGHNSDCCASRHTNHRADARSALERMDRIHQEFERCRKLSLPWPSLGRLDRIVSGPSVTSVRLHESKSTTDRGPVQSSI